MKSVFAKLTISTLVIKLLILLAVLPHVKVMLYR